MEAKVVISGDAAGLKLAISNAAVSLVELGATSRQAASSINAAMGRAEGDVGRLNKSLDTSQSLMGKLAGAAAGVISVAAIVSLAKEASALNLALERTSNTLRFASGSSQAYAANNEFLRTTVHALGLDLQSAGQQFASLTAAAKGTSLEGAGARSIFDAVAKASTVMGLSADQTAGSLLAISQMISKGTVSAEELRGQLGERLPGAFQTAARAMGVTTAELGKLLESGALATDVFLPRFAAQMRQDMGGSVKEAADSVQANLNRVKTDWANLVTVVSNSAFTNESLKGIDQFLRAMTGTLEKSKDDFAGWGDSLANVLAFVGDAAATSFAIIKIVPDSLAAVAAQAKVNLDRSFALENLAYSKDRPAKAAAIQANYDAQIAAIQSGIAERERALLTGTTRLRDTLAKQRADIAAANADPEFRKAQEKIVSYQNEADRALLATKPVLGGGKDKKEAASAYDAISKSIEQTLALANEELASGEKLNAADKFRVTSINKLSEAYADGKISWDEWSKGYDKTIVAADARALADNTTALNKHLDALREGNALTQMEIETGVVYSAAQQKALKILQEMTNGTRQYSEEGAIALRVEIERSIVQERGNAQRKAQFAADEKALDSLQAEVQGLRESNQAMTLHNQEIGLTKEALAALTLARQDELIAIQASVVAEDADAIARGEATAAMQLQINKLDELKRKRALVASGSVAEAAADVNKRAVDDAKKVIESIDKTAQDVWRSVFEGGSNAFEQIGKAIKREVIDVLYQMIAKKWVVNVATSVAGSLGFSGAAQAGSALAGGGGSGSGGLLNTAGSLGGLFGSSAAYGAAIGTTSVGVGSQAAMLAAQTAEFGLAGLTATAEAGAAAAGAMGSLTTALAAIPGWGWVAMGAVALLSMGGGGFKSSATTGETSIGVDTAGRVTNLASRRGNSEASDSAVTNLKDTYLKSAAALGIKAAATEFFYDGNTGAQGENPQFALSGGVVGKGGYAIGETPVSDAAISLAASRAVFATLQNSELPKYLAGIFDGLDAGRLSQEQITNTLATAQAFKGLHDQLQALPFADLKDLTYSTAAALVAASGGMDKLGANLTTYYDKFYSDTEKTANLTANVTKAFADMGLALPALDANARAAFRSLVEGQDMSTEAGVRNRARLLALAGSFDQLVPVLEATASNTKDLTAALKEQASWQDKLDVLTGTRTQREISLRNDLADASNDAIKALIKQVYAQEDANAAAQAQADAARAAAQAANDAAQTIRDAWAGITDSLMDEVRRLRGEIDEGADDSVARVQAKFDITTAQARAGDKEAAKLLPTLAGTLDRVAQTNSESMADLRRVQGRTAASLEETSRIINALSAQQVAAVTVGGGPTGTANASRVVAGPGYAPAATAQVSTAKYQDRYNLLGYTNATDVTDAAQIAKYDQIGAIVARIGVGSPEAIKALAAEVQALGGTMDDVAGATGYFRNDVRKVFLTAGVPAFAGGGFHQGGVRIVGENGPEVELTGPSRILNQAQIGDALRSGGAGAANMQRLEALVQALTEEVKGLRVVSERAAGHAARTSNALEGGNGPLLMEVAA